MKRNKSSIVYQYLPHNWVSYSDGDLRGSYSMKVNYWLWKEMEGIYEKRLNQHIKRKLKMFRGAGGDVSEYGDVSEDISFKFVQIDPKEGFAPIKGTISPLVFYCNGCGFTKSFSKFPHDSSTLICPKCRKKMKQIQLIYPCTCGNAKPVFTTNDPGKIYKFKPIANDPKSNFRFTVVENGHEKTQEMVYKCECGKTRYPMNAFDGRNYKPHSITTVNLIDQKEGTLLQYGNNAEKLQIGRWLELVTEEEYKKILEDPNKYFSGEISNEEIETKVRTLIELAGMTEEVARATVMAKIKGSECFNWLNGKISEIDSHVSLLSNQTLSEELVEYFTVKNPLRKMELTEAIEKMISIDAIYDEAEIDELHKKMGICNVQVSYDTEIVNSTYGYTRIYSDPGRVPDGKLKLKAYTQKNEINMLAYSNKLKTEGILVEFDRAKIISWLRDNNVIKSEECPPADKEKEWFIKMVNSELIEQFGEIDDSEENKITKYIYGLIHTISHMMIKSAGEISGLSKDSLSEIIFPNIPAIFIYANTSQAIPLGSLSGMFEMNYKDFLDKTFELSKDCIFDPLCSNDKGACSGCTYLSEISCSNYNLDLSRFYLIGTPKTHKKKKMKGFWM